MITMTEVDSLTVTGCKFGSGPYYFMPRPGGGGIVIRNNIFEMERPLDERFADFKARLAAALEKRGVQRC